MVDRRWPLQPLLDETGLSLHELRLVTKGDSWTARQRGLSDEMADRWALRCGLMPHEVWDGWFDAALTENDRHYLAGGWRQAWLWREANTELDQEAA